MRSPFRSRGAPAGLALVVSCVLHGAAGIALSQGPAPLEQARSVSDLPPQLLEPWELKSRDRLDGDLLPSRRNRRAIEAFDKLERFAPDPALLNLSSPGLCYAGPLKWTVLKRFKQIQENVERGRRAAADTKIVFAGLLRDAEPSLQAAYAMMKRIGLMFSDYYFIILENDSIDGTRNQLELIARQDEKFNFSSQTLNLTFERGLGKARTARMANLRNMLQDMIREFVQPRTGWDLIAVYDFDLNLFEENSVFPHMFLNTLGREGYDWDMVCANSLRHVHNQMDAVIGYHDCFAFREPGHDGFNGRTCGTTIAATMYDSYAMKEMHSCFGGLAIYKSSQYLACRYDPDEWDCEHVPLNRCMRETQGSEHRMFMDPLLTTIYGDGIPQFCTTPQQASKEYFIQEMLHPGDTT